jgi:hypothetical protein
MIDYLAQVGYWWFLCEKNYSPPEAANYSESISSNIYMRFSRPYILTLNIPTNRPNIPRLHTSDTRQCEIHKEKRRSIKDASVVGGAWRHNK